MLSRALLLHLCCCNIDYQQTITTKSDIKQEHDCRMRNLVIAPALPGRHQHGFLASQTKQLTTSVHSLFKVPALCKICVQHTDLNYRLKSAHYLIPCAGAHCAQSLYYTSGSMHRQLQSCASTATFKTHMVLALIAAPTTSMTTL